MLRTRRLGATGILVLGSSLMFLLLQDIRQALSKLRVKKLTAIQVTQLLTSLTLLTLKPELLSM